MMRLINQVEYCSIIESSRFAITVRSGYYGMSPRLEVWMPPSKRVQFIQTLDPATFYMY